MAVIIYTLSDFGLQPFAGMMPEVIFRPSGAGVKEGRLFASTPVVSIPDSTGAGSVTLESTDGVVPETWYEVSIEHLQPGGNHTHFDVLGLRLFIPEGYSGPIASLPGTPLSPYYILVSLNQPAPGYKGWWLYSPADGQDMPLNDPLIGDLRMVDVTGEYKTVTNLRGPAARIVAATAETVSATTPASVEMTGPDQGREFDFKVPRGMPGVNALDNDEAVATYLSAPDSETYQAAAAGFTRADEIVINVDRYPSVQAAIDAAPAGSRLFFPPSMSPVSVPTGGFALKSNGLTIDAMGVEFRVAAWGTPAFLALRANGGADGHTFRLGLVRYIGVRGTHLGATVRGSAPYCSGCGVWSNGDRNTVEYLRTVGMPTPIFFSSWDGTGASDRIGVGNRIGYLEAEGYDFALLFVRQEGYDWGNAFCHNDIDDSGGANPTHAIYGSAATGFPAGAGTIGTWVTRDHTGGNAYQFKYSHNITADRLFAERSAGVLSVQNCNGFTATLVSGTALSPALAGARMVEFVGVDACRRVHVGQIIVDKAQNTDSESVILVVNDVCEIGSISITARHSPSVITSSAELSVRGVGAGMIGSVQVVTTGPAMRPVRLGSGVESGRAVGWMLPSVRSLGAGAALDAIPVEEQIHCFSNAWGDGNSFLAGAVPARGIFRRGMRWGNSAPSAGVARGWVQTVNGALSGATWAASTAVAAGVWWKLANGRVIRYLMGGNTGTTEPNPTTVGETGTDGSATWEYVSLTSGTVVSEGNL